MWELRRYYEATASEYDSFLEEELSAQETKSFLSLVSPDYSGPVLDVASGTGRLSKELTSRGLYYVGLDLSNSMLRVLREKTSGATLDLVCGSATKLPFRDSSFPLVTCFGLTGYFNHQTQKELMTEFSRVISDNGDIAVDFLRPSTRSSRLIRTEETREGNRVYLLSLGRIRRGLSTAHFKIIENQRTTRQIQFLLRKKSGKD